MLLLQDLHVEVDELEEGLGRGVVVPALVGQVLLGHLVDGAVDVGHELRHRLLDAARHDVQLVEEAHRDRDERLLRPLVEPVDARAVHQRGELAPAHAQGVPHGGEAENHLDIKIVILRHLLDAVPGS